MTGNGPSGETPDLNDSAWVDDILARALERARSAPGTTPAPSPSVTTSAAPSAEPQAAPSPVEPPAAAAPPAAASPPPAVAPPAPVPVVEPQPAPSAPTPEADAPVPVTQVAAAPVVAPADAPVRRPDTNQPLFPREVPSTAVTTTPRPDPRPEPRQIVNPSPQVEAIPPSPADTAALGDNDIPELDEYLAEPVANRRMRSAIEWTAVIIGALVVAVLIKSFMFQAFFIPTPSMRPTLEVGDRILVNKLSYNVGDLSRGDVVVFHKPENASGDVEDLVKRVIALPGETLQIREGNIYIDGRLLEEPYLEEPQSSVWTASLPPGCVPTGSSTECQIPEGTAFVMGDNRTNSTDSRVFGPIDQDLIVGRAFLRVYPFTNIGRL